ncbi:hypothetical protein [Microcystis phage MJing1]|nr:hypothetical protein [Microcystis phage MJing1]
MSKGGSRNQTTTTQVQLPAWLDAFAQDTLGMAGDVAARPFVPNPIPGVAGFTPDQTAAQGAIRGMQGQTSAALDDVASRALGVAGFTPERVTAGSLPGVDMSAYLNPFLDNVERAGLDAIEESRLNATNGVADRAIAAGAFGGSREAIQRSLVDRAAMTEAGRFSAGVRSQGFQQAQDAAMADLNRAMQGGIANQQADIQGAGVAMQGLGLAGGLISQGQDATLRDIAALDASGTTQQMQQQRTLDDQIARWQEQQDHPLRQLQIRLAAMQGTPYGQTSTSTGPGGTRGSPAMGALGGALSGAQLGSLVPGIGTGIGAAVGGVFGLLGGR